MYGRSLVAYGRSIGNIQVPQDDILVLLRDIWEILADKISGAISGCQQSPVTDHDST